MVTPYPPARDGIAAYAVQSVARLRAEGHDVEVLSPQPSAAHWHLDLVGPRGALALAKRVRCYDKVIVHFHPEVLFPVPTSPNQWRVESLALFVAFRWAREVEVLVHEIDYTRGRGNPATRFVNRLPWRTATRIVVHTEVEADQFSEAFGVARDRITVIAHGSDFRRNTAVTKEQARATLGLPAGDLVFLNIGFIQPHKGFDRAVAAVARLHDDGVTSGYRLDIVGSVRTADPGYVQYLDELRGLVEATPVAHMHVGYVSPELFDRWLVASDVVVLPYRSIWSSSVFERALLYDCRVIATNVGGLSHQKADRDRVTLVEDDAGLRQAMAEMIGTGGGAGAGGGDGQSSDGGQGGGAAGGNGHHDRSRWDPQVGADRETVQAEIQLRAARRRRVAGSVSASISNGASVVTDLPSSHVRQVAPLVLPEPASRLPGGEAVKRLLSRALTWKFDPVVRQLNLLRQAVIDDLDAHHRSEQPAGSDGVSAEPAEPQPAE